MQHLVCAIFIFQTRSSASLLMSIFSSLLKTFLFFKFSYIIRSSLYPHMGKYIEFTVLS